MIDLPMRFNGVCVSIICMLTTCTVCICIKCILALTESLVFMSVPSRTPAIFLSPRCFQYARKTRISLTLIAEAMHANFLHFTLSLWVRVSSSTSLAASLPLHAELIVRENAHSKRRMKHFKRKLSWTWTFLGLFLCAPHQTHST